MRSLILATVFALVAMPARAELPIPVLSRPALDPARVRIAEGIAAKILPSGYLRKALQSPISDIVLTVGHRIAMRPVSQFVAATGVALPTEGLNGPPTVQMQLLEILDPVSMTRTERGEPALMAALGTIADQMETGLREAIARAYARNLNAAQLSDLEHFFETSSGSIYASRLLNIQTDPDIAAADQQYVRAVLQAIPDIGRAMDNAATDLPKPKNAVDLTETERDKIAHLLGVKPAQLMPKESAK